MAPEANEFTLGVEEEYQIVDATTRGLRQAGKRIVPAAQEVVGQRAQPELYLSQVEVHTPVCTSLGEVRAELRRLRKEVGDAAAQEGHRVAAAGTHPFSHWDDQRLTPKDRYRGLAEDYQQLAREQIICGCHVHVGISDKEAVIQTMNRAGMWLGPLVALTANSPFWLGSDSGYASFGREMWRRWPMAGIPPQFESRADYDELMQSLVQADVIKEPTKIYWDMRPSTRFDTLEFRVTDVCMTVDEAVMITGLTRGLARTCYEHAQSDKPLPTIRPELLVAAKWRASRYGLEGKLIDLEARTPVPAPAAIERLLAFVRPALERDGEWDEVSSLVKQTLGRGTGAARQRRALARSGSLEGVVDLIISETAAG